MKIYFSELPPDYSTYTFPHAVYAEAESNDLISSIYAQGFLPYSADINNQAKLFYLCRSLRIDHNLFQNTSENRRVDKKMSLPQIQAELIPCTDWDYTNKDHISIIKNYIKIRFPKGAMPDERLHFIMNHPLATHVLLFRDQEKRIISIVLCSIHQDIVHYWFSFFDHTYLSDFPIGKWVMWRTIHWAKDAGYRYTYLGTCYHTKSLYKARDFKGVQFFDGHQWNNEIKELKHRVHEDGENFTVDRWRRDGILPSDDGS